MLIRVYFAGTAMQSFICYQGVAIEVVSLVIISGLGLYRGKEQGGHINKNTDGWWDGKRMTVVSIGGLR